MKKHMKNMPIIVMLAGALALGLIGCDNGGDTHTHSYSTTWSSNATQHWHECTANDGAKTDEAAHTGDPCTVCGYSSSSSDITYTAVQTGGTDNVTDSTGIVFTFSASVDSLDLTVADITVGGTATKGTTALSGSGTTRTLAITVNSAGTATVSINKTGIEAETKNVTVYKAGQSAPTLTGITAVYTGTAIIYPTTPLNDLKAGLTVKAQYSNSSENTLSSNEYTLNGTLIVGTSAETVTYQEQTTTFNVTVTAQLNPGEDSITVNFTAIADETINLGDVNTLSTGGNITVTVTGSYTSYEWYIDGEKAEGTTNQIVITRSSLKPGPHTVTAIVKKGTTPYSKVLKFTK